MTRPPIPIAALDQPLAIVGTVGSGKTYAAKSAIEALLHEQRRVIIVDPTGVWHGLRTMADGSPGFPVVIFGGEQADVPLAPDADAGTALGTLLAEDRVTQAIVDVSDMTGGERTRFLTAMLERLYVGARVPRHLILDEADEMASQNPLPEQLRLMGIVDKIVRRGRVRGFRPMMITQRPAVLHKNVLSQIATLVAMRLTSPQDRKAIEGWVKGSADLDEAKAVLTSLPKLAVGEGWVWAPREGVLERTRFPAITTLDTSATPETGVAQRSRTMAKVDVAALREALATSVSPSTNRPEKGSELQSLERIASAPQPTAPERPASAAEIAEAERRGYDRGVTEGETLGLMRGAAAGWRAAATCLQRDLDGFLSSIRSPGDHDTGEEEIAKALGLPTWPKEVALPAVRTPASERKKSRQITSADIPATPPAPTPEQRPPRQRVLDSLGWWHSAGFPMVNRARAAVTAGYSPRASTFGVYIAELVKCGLVATGTGTVGLTEQGISAASVPELVTADDLRGYARALLKPQEARVFDVIYAKAGAPIRRADVATALGFSPTASTVGVYLGKVAAFGLIETVKPGTVRAAPWLFSLPTAAER